MDQSNVIMLPVKVEDSENAKISIEILLNTFIRELMDYVLKYSDLASYSYLRFYTLFKSMLKLAGHKEAKNMFLLSNNLTRMSVIEKEMSYSDPSNSLPNVVTIYDVSSNVYSAFLGELREQINLLSNNENIELMFSDISSFPLITDCSICLKVDKSSDDNMVYYVRSFNTSNGTYLPIIDVRYHWGHNCVTIQHNIVHLYRGKRNYFKTHTISFLYNLYSIFCNLVSNTILKESIKGSLIPSPILMKSLTRDVSCLHNKEIMLDTNIEGITNDDNSVQLCFEFIEHESYAVQPF